MFQELSEISVKKLNPEELKYLLENSKILREENTYLCDFIRILEYNGNLFIQETSDKNEILIRKMNSLESAEKFVQARLEFYDRKWDGCGCKVDYYS
ncbi:MAG: hypothetical protein NZM09_06220 [Ignavibacterium sp.]|nr:hypothetical protein [Ignavibacterium sp.]MCX7610767.1 hypothetical protein [Ignavibacterium sp.]MDW8375275.1 hypothetical protein [Ignavibacteriales bacterium]